jgi:hypothetical protein
MTLIGLLALNLVVLLMRPAGAQPKPEPSTRTMAGEHGPCVGIAAATARDGDLMVFRAFADGTVEERRSSEMVAGKIIYTWKPALRPAH